MGVVLGQSGETKEDVQAGLCFSCEATRWVAGSRCSLQNNTEQGSGHMHVCTCSVTTVDVFSWSCLQVSANVGVLVMPIQHAFRCIMVCLIVLT